MKQSATSISDFKRCPMSYHIRHNLRLKPVEDQPALRMGTNWHRCLEILTMEPEAVCEPCGSLATPNPLCPLCDGSGFYPKDLSESLIRELDQAYAHKPNGIEWVDWAVEKYTILYSALGWQWRWQDDQIITLGREIPFKRKVDNLTIRQGIIDRIIRRNHLASLGEYKSTTKSVDSGSVFWDGLNLDTQPSVYLIEARLMQQAGDLIPYGLKPTDPLISGVLYDVWSKPTTKPKKLSQADTKKFLVDETYYGTELRADVLNGGPGIGFDSVIVNGEDAEITPGKEPKPTKKNPEPVAPFAIRETPEMYGIRLLNDITENPDKFFARRDIPRTDEQLARADQEFKNIARVTNLMTVRNLWFTNEGQCSATWRCPFLSLCQNGLVPEDDTIPDGFIRRG